MHSANIDVTGSIHNNDAFTAYCLRFRGSSLFYLCFASNAEPKRNRSITEAKPK